MAMNDQHAAMFLQLVFTFQSAAWQHMGKIKNPITDKVEKDLMQARFSIDMLEMIRAKTEGNLSDEEKRLIDGTISQLQLNYVDEFNREQAEGKEEAKAEAEAEGKEEAKPEAEAEDKEKGEAKPTAENKAKKSSGTSSGSSKKTATRKKSSPKKK